MLSIKKVKIHGIKDDRWTTQDKVSQYKGVITLYTRDQKIVKVDNINQHKKYDKMIKELKKNIIDHRFQLDNAIYGDKQIIKNILAEYDEFRLALSNLEPVIIIEHVHQHTFNKRKQLDLLNFQIKEATNKLIDLKLEAAVLEDRLKYTIDEKLPIELEAAVLTGKIQDAILRREAAVVVQHSYKAILDVMKKDSDYMFQVLEALRDDAKNQGMCMYNTTKLGQLATEYLDDRRQEFIELEVTIKQDLKIRKADLEQIRNQVESIDNSIRHLIRRDSDITCNINRKEYINRLSEDSLETLRQLKELEETMNFLKETTLVSNFHCIFPCIQEQFRQTDRLNHFMSELQSQRDIIFNKLKHAHQMYKDQTFIKGTSRYHFEIEKDRLEKLVEEQKERKRKTQEHEAYKCDVLLKIRIALQRLEEMTVIVFSPKIKHAITHELMFETDLVHDRTDEIIEYLESKFQALAQVGEVLLKPEYEYQAFNKVQTVLERITCAIDMTAKVVEESLIEGITFEDGSIPNRQDIKKLSDSIVEANSKTDDLLPPPPRRKMKIKLRDRKSVV